MSVHDTLESFDHFARAPKDLIYSELSSKAVRIFLMLDEHSGKSSRIYPGHKRLASLGRCSVDTIIRALNELEDTGWITVTRIYSSTTKTNGTNNYRLYASPVSKENRTTTTRGAALDEVGSNGATQRGGLQKCDPGVGSKNATQVGSKNATPTRTKYEQELSTNYRGTPTATPIESEEPSLILVGDEPATTPEDGSAQILPIPTLVPEPVRLDVEQVCGTLARGMVANGGRKPTVTLKWRDEARRLLDKDKIPLDEVLAVLEWSQKDGFWKSNILSVPTFRKNYDRLVIKFKEERRREYQARIALQNEWCQ